MQNSRKKSKLNQQRKLNINKKLSALCLSLLIGLSPALSVTITDDFVEQTLDKNLKINEYKAPVIIDTFAESNKNKSAPRKVVQKPEEVLPKVVKPYKPRKYVITEEFRPSVPIRIVNYFTTGKNPQEGSYIDFVTASDVEYKGKVIPAGTKVRGRIETVSANAMNGDPANVVIGSFDMNGVPLYGEISKTGADRMLWVKPLSFAVGIFGIPGFALMFIRGGHAKIKPREIYTIYF